MGTLWNASLPGGSEERMRWLLVENRRRGLGTCGACPSGGFPRAGFGVIGREGFERGRGAVQGAGPGRFGGGKVVGWRFHDLDLFFYGEHLSPLSWTALTPNPSPVRRARVVIGSDAERELENMGTLWKASLPDEMAEVMRDRVSDFIRISGF